MRSGTNVVLISYSVVKLAAGTNSKRSGTAACQSQQVAGVGAHAAVGAVAKCRPNRLIRREATAFESSTTAVYYLIYRLVAGETP